MRIKEVLKTQGKTQQELADLLGISLSAVKQMVNAQSLTTTTVEKIADVLEVPVWQLFASPEEVCGANSTDFTAFVRNGGELRAFDSAESLKEYVDELCGDAKRHIHANIRRK